jgi:hypothetical protein
MPDIRERLDVFNHLEPPELWTAAQHREPRSSVDHGRPRARRIGVALLALAIAAAGIGLAVRAFTRSSSIVPIAPTAKKNGEIVFVRGASGSHAQLWTMDPGGTSERPLSFGIGGAGFVSGAASFPSWSPDGTELVFSFSRLSGGASSLYLVHQDGSGLRGLTSCEHPTCLQDSEPAWSPDGTRIAFVRNEDIYVMNADGSGIQRLTHATTPLGVGQPSWSPDGRQIAFIVARVQPYNLPAIDVMNTDGTDVRQLTGCLPGCTDSEPAWSPDGTQIAFVRGMSSSPIGTQDVWMMKPDGTDARPITSCVAIAGCVAAGDPAWSPDGRQIAFTVEGHDSVRQLFVMNADGSDVHPLLAKTSDVCCLAWQPVTAGTSPAPSSASSPSEAPPAAEIVGTTPFSVAQTELYAARGTSLFVLVIPAGRANSITVMSVNQDGTVTSRQVPFDLGYYLMNVSAGPEGVYAGTAVVKRFTVLPDELVRIDPDSLVIEARFARGAKRARLGDHGDRASAGPAARARRVRDTLRGVPQSGSSRGSGDLA